MTIDAVPTTREELNRKTADTLVEALNRVDAGRMTKRDLGLVGKTLWSATAGLVDEQISDACSEAAMNLSAEPMKRHFIGNGTLRTVAWFPDRAGFVVKSRDAHGKVLNVNARKTDIGERETELETLFAALRKAGYVEL